MGLARELAGYTDTAHMDLSNTTISRTAQPAPTSNKPFGQESYNTTPTRPAETKKHPPLLLTLPKLPQSNNSPSRPATTIYAGSTGCKGGNAFKGGMTDKVGPTLVGVSSLYRIASRSKLLLIEPLVAGSEDAILAALDDADGGGIGYDSSEGEKILLLATLTPLPTESWLDRRAFVGRREGEKSPLLPLAMLIRES